MKNFPCTKCGACCKKVHLSQETMFLDRGDGVCIHFNQGSLECKIYDSRPDICRVDVQYFMKYRNHYSWEEFVKVNQDACEILAMEDK